jgi:NADH-quinone oxidoreductase subunit I
MFRLLKGFGITLKYFGKEKVTIQYPEEKPDTPDRFRGIQRFFPDLCIVCNMCVNVCPTDVITLTGKPHPDNPKKKIIDTYNIDFQGCILCDFCTEVCPTDAIVMTAKYDNLADYVRTRNPDHEFTDGPMFKDMEWLTNNEVYGNYVITEEDEKIKVEKKSIQKLAAKPAAKAVAKAEPKVEAKADDKERGEEK